MNTSPEQIAQEIRQIIAQYQQEVPGGRRAWPESLKARVIELAKNGWAPKQIAAQTEVSYYTVLAWVPREYRRRYRSRASKEQDSAQFLPIKVRKHREIASMTVTQSVKSPRSSDIATVTVTLRGGIRIKGVTPEFLRAWLGGESS